MGHKSKRGAILPHLHGSTKCDGDDDDDLNSVMALDKVEDDITAHQQ
jgi:hypothetical protein